MPETSVADAYRPIIYDVSNPSEKDDFYALIHQNASIQIFDEIHGQLLELVKIKNPTKRLTVAESQVEIEQVLAGLSEIDYGLWVYYPWGKRVVHIVPRNEFIALRTSRNQYKITPEEQQTLSTKKIGVIGLSVGASIAITMATERIFGEIRLADYDTLELTNLNRLRAGIHQLGQAKVILAAREIAEMDPFLEVKCFEEGITEDNIEGFLTHNGKLDILVEECDSIDVKIFSRLQAKKHGIPVIMDTNDRGMIDIERFDLEPERPILHGLVDHLDITHTKNLSNEEKLPFLAPLIGLSNVSDRLKKTIPEIGKSVTTWPQLASATALGGAIATETARKVLLHEKLKSGRYYIDLDLILQSE